MRGIPGCGTSSQKPRGSGSRITCAWSRSALRAPPTSGNFRRAAPARSGRAAGRERWLSARPLSPLTSGTTARPRLGWLTSAQQTSLWVTRGCRSQESSSSSRWPGSATNVHETMAMRWRSAMRPLRSHLTIWPPTRSWFASSLRTSRIAQCLTGSGCALSATQFPMA